MEMALLQDTGKGLRARQQNDDSNHERHGADQLSRDKKESVDGRSPVRRQRHHPVDGGKAHRKNVKNNARPGEHLQAAAQGTVILVDVLLYRPAIEEEHQEQPDDEVNCRAQLKASDCQISLLELREWFFLEFFRIQPRTVEILHAKKSDWNKERGNERKRAGSRFQRAPNDDAPLAGHQMLQHQEAETTKRQAQKKHETHQIGLVEKARGTHGSEKGDHQGDAAYEERALLKAANALGRPIFLRSHQ